MLDTTSMLTARSVQTASTNNWDTVFALDFDAVNAGIAGQATYPGNFNHTEGVDPDTTTIEGDFSSWKLVGGSGHLLEMEMEIGEFIYNKNKPDEETRQNAICRIQIELRVEVGAEGSGIGGGTPVSFRTRRADAFLANMDNYTIVVLDMSWPGSTSEPLLATECRILMAGYFNDPTTQNEFDHTFATVNLNSRLESKSGDLSWIAPTDTSYGVVANGARGGGTFAVMCMIGGHMSPDHHNVSPEILGDKRAGFLLNKPVFLDHMIKPGIATMFGRDPDDQQFFDDNFTIESDAITNKTEISVPDFQVIEHSADNPDTVTAVVPKRSFSISMLDTRLVINFNGLHHPYYKIIGYLYEAHHYYSIQTQAAYDAENRTFGLVPFKAADNEPIISYRAALEKSSFGKAVDITLLVIDILAVAGTAFKGIAALRAGKVAADVTQESTAAVKTVFGSAKLGAALASLKAFFTHPITILVGSVVAGAAGIAFGVVKDNWENNREDDPERMKPDMQDFATSVMAPIQWPEGAGLAVEDVRFNGGFHITGTPDFTTA